MKSSSTELTLMMPAFLNRTSEATSEVAKAPVCDDAALAPAAVLPLFTATIGFLAETRRAILANWSGVTERLQVKQDDFGGRVLFPVL